MWMESYRFTATDSSEASISCHPENPVGSGTNACSEKDFFFMSNFVNHFYPITSEKANICTGRREFDRLHVSVTGKHLSEYGASLMSPCKRKPYFHTTELKT
jgi:hypothetical protein